MLLANRESMALNADSVTTDVSQFELTLAKARAAPADHAGTQLLADAVDLCAGEFMAGYHEDWGVAEQRRLAEEAHAALIELLRRLESAGDLETAIRYALRGVTWDSLREGGIAT